MLLEKCRTEGIGLIIIDPTYKLNQATEENAAEDVGRLLNEFEQIALETNAAIVFCHHFAKGTAADRNSVDRASGSGVWARDPDAILTISPHEDPECMIVETHLRNFKAVPAFVIRWKYPVWERDLQADPTAHYRPQRSRSSKPQKPPHRPRSVTPAEVKQFLQDPQVQDACPTLALKVQEAMHRWDLSRSQVYRYFSEAGVESDRESEPETINRKDQAP
ncbi:MAG: AAA family ATPase [Verrucomicrobiales bacterium]|nr:AAA family ATPase [Verrucomicrobiales bacterium]